MITVNEILQRKKTANNITSPGTLVIDALKLLSSVNLSYLVIMDGNKFNGIFCERDYCRNVILKDRSSKTTIVQEVMTTDLPIVDINDTAEYCMKTMNENKARYLLALDSSSDFAGIITIHDLLRQVLRNREYVFDNSIAEQLTEQEEGEKIF
jgi:signal-transduction protein with cAMP-binding, CBS, and nucleotidyltransferase domain